MNAIITTAEQLDALPVGSVLKDQPGDKWYRYEDGWGIWVSCRRISSTDLVRDFPESAPFVLLNSEILADYLRDPLWDAVIDAVVGLNLADKALSDAVYGPSTGSRTDTTRLQNERDAAQDRAREAVIAWKDAR